MQIKTAVTLAGGAAVGFFFGMCAPEETKGKIVSGIKDRIVYALTGEHMDRKPVTYRGPNYANYKMQYGGKTVREPKGTKETKEFDWDRFKTEKLIFSTEEKAEAMLNWIQDYVNNYENISVHTLAMALGETHLDWSWDKYGWRKSATDFATVGKLEDDPLNQGCWRILITDPYPLSD